MTAPGGTLDQAIDALCGLTAWMLVGVALCRLGWL